MVCGGLEILGSDPGILDLLRYPTTCDYYFYAKIMFGLWFILTFGVFKIEEKRIGKSDFLSAAGVSALAIIFLSIIGSLLTIIQSDVLVKIMIAGGVFVFLWLIKR